MKPSRLLVGVFLLSAALVCLIGVALLRADQDPSDRGQRNEDSVLRYLAPALSSAGEGARIYYRAECNTRKTQRWDPVPFPRVGVHVSSKGVKGLAAVREMFRGDKDVAVTEGPSGMIRIRIGNAQGRILQTKLRRLTLGFLEQHFPEWTIYRIGRARDLKAAMRRLRVKAAPFSPPLESVRVPRGAPHLPSVMRNVTVEQVLDLTATTFKGIVVYGACTQPSGRSLFRLDYIELPILRASSRTVRDVEGPVRHPSRNAKAGTR